MGFADLIALDRKTNKERRLMKESDYIKTLMMAENPRRKEPVAEPVPSTGRRNGRNFDPYQGDIEESLVSAIDDLEIIKKYQSLYDALSKDEIDPHAFLQGVSKDVAVKLVATALKGSSEKIRLEAQKDILDRAGYGKVQKIAVAQVDPKQPKEQLISLIAGLAHKTGALVIDDDEAIETGSSEAEQSGISSDSEETETN